MEKNNIIELYRLLVELRNEGSISEAYRKEADRAIRHLEDELEKKGPRQISINIDLIGVIATIFKAWLSPP